MTVYRKCQFCGEPTLAPKAKTMSATNSTTRYECTNCAFKVDLIPSGSLGVQLTVFSVVAMFLWFIFFTGPGPNSLLSVVAFWAAMAILPAMSVSGLWKNYKNPEIQGSHRKEIDDPKADKHILKRPIEWIERRHTLVGLMAPLVLIAGILGLAAIVGFINFTYFE